MRPQWAHMNLSEVKMLLLDLWEPIIPPTFALPNRKDEGEKEQSKRSFTSSLLSQKSHLPLHPVKIQPESKTKNQQKILKKFCCLNWQIKKILALVSLSLWIEKQKQEKTFSLFLANSKKCLTFALPNRKKQGYKKGKGLKNNPHCSFNWKLHTFFEWRK